MIIKRKHILGILAVTLSILLYSCYYIWAVGFYKDYPEPEKNIDYYMGCLLYFTMYISLSLSFFALGIDAERKLKYLIYNTGGSFWLMVFAAYLTRDIFEIYKSRNLFIFLIMGTVLISLSLYFINITFKKNE